MRIKGVMKKAGIIMAAVLIGIGVGIGTPVTALPSHFYSFSIDKTEQSIKEGEELTLTVSGNAVLFGATTWSSSDESVAKIDSIESGSFGLNKGYRAKVKGIKEGTAVITAQNSKNTEALTCKVTVKRASDDQQETEKPDSTEQENTEQGNGDQNQTDAEKKLEAPKITSATNQGTRKTGKLTAAWTNVNGAAQYQIQISSKKDFSDLKTDDKTRETSYSTTWHYYNYVGTGAKNPVYYYRVRAIGADGAYSAWSEVVSRAVE